MSSNNLKVSDNFSSLGDEWVKLKRHAITTNKKEDWDFYKWFLNEAKKGFSQLYASENLAPKIIELTEQILQLITCELKEIDIKYKKIKE